MSSETTNIPLTLLLLYKLQDTFSWTDAGECWGNMAGIPYWFALGGSVAIHEVIGGQNLDI